MRRGSIRSLAVEYLRTADTPTKRLGLVLMWLALLAWLGMVVHWNLSKRPFLYQETHSWIERAAKPTESTEGAYWAAREFGWVLYNEKCLERGRFWRSINPAEMFNKDCQMRVVPHRQKFRTVWTTSISDFAEELFDSRWGDYYWLNLASAFILFSGLLMRSGVFEKAVQWVRTGSGSVPHS